MNRLNVWIVAGVSFALAVTTCAQTPTSSEVITATYLAQTKTVSVPTKKPSGLAYHQKRNSILMVDEGGILVETDLELNEKARWNVPGDLEGVAVNPITGTVFLISEATTTLIEFDLAQGKEMQRFVVALGSHPEFLEDRDLQKGIEGVAVLSQGDQLTLFVVHEVLPPRLLRLHLNLSSDSKSVPDAKPKDPQVAALEKFAIVDKGWDPGLRTLNDLAFDISTQTFLVTSSRDKTVRVLDSTGKVARSFDLPGPSPKGFCLLPNGDALVVHGSEVAQVIPGFRKVIYPAP